MSMASKCLVCDEEIPEQSNQSNGTYGTSGLQAFKKFRADPCIPNVSNYKTKYALTPSQVSVLQRVLKLPGDACKAELAHGPYCRGCFTNMNNVFHSMSVLESLQQSVIDFRKDFGSKLKRTCGNNIMVKPTPATRKRKSAATATEADSSEGDFFSARAIILKYLSTTVFATEIDPPPPSLSRSRHIHEIISNMDPNGCPETHVHADLVVRTTNGNMPIHRKKKKKVAPKLTPQKTTGKKRATATVSAPTKTAVSSSRMTQNSKATETGSGNHKCWCCGKAFKTESELSKHEETDHKFKCTECSKWFYTQTSLDAHILQHQQNQKPLFLSPLKKKKKKRNTSSKITKKRKVSQARRTIECNLCPSGSKKYPNVMALGVHKARVHSVPKPNSTATATTVSSSPKKDVVKIGPVVIKRPGRCKVCKKIVMDVQGHIKSQHPEEAVEKEKSFPSSIPSSSNSEKPKTEQSKLLNVNGVDSDSHSDSNSKEERSPTNASSIFRVPNLSKVSTTPSPSQTSPNGSKYQFKNLLKIGDGEK